MRRRQFISLVGATVVASPIAAAAQVTTQAQQRKPLKHVGALMLYSENAQGSIAHITAFQQGLEKLGWKLDGNIQIDYRWNASDPVQARSAANDLVELKPDVILANGSPAAAALH